MCNSYEAPLGVSFSDYAAKINRSPATLKKVKGWKSKIPLIYINTKNSKERQVYVKRTFSNLFHNLIRSEGITSVHPQVKELMKRMPHVNPNILAVTLSHLNAIKLADEVIRRTNDPTIQHAIIIEDDADPILMPFWEKSIDSIVAGFPKGWEVVQLGATKVTAGETTPVYRRAQFPHKKGVWNQPEWGAFAYILSKRGTRKIASTDLVKLFSVCQTMTADDCLLDFAPLKNFFFNTGRQFDFYHQYILHPPLFTVNTAAQATHRTSLNKMLHETVANAGRCSSFFEHIMYYNDNSLA